MAGDYKPEIEVITRKAPLRALERDWKTLFGRGAESPYSSFEWFATAWEHFGDDERLRLCVVRRGSRIVGIIPLELSVVKVGPFRCRVLGLALGGWPTSNGALIADRGSSILDQVLCHLADREPRWDYCRLTRLYPDSLLLREARAVDGAPGILPACFRSGPTAILELPKCWEDFRRNLSKRMRSNLRYYSNVLGRNGQLELKRVALEHPGDIDMERTGRLLEDALAVHTRTWQAQATSGSSIGEPGVVGFFLEVSRRMAESGMLDISVLYVGGRPVSFMWGVARDGRVSVTKIGFDQQLRDHRVGSIHMAKMIADSIKRGVIEIDLGHETLDFKVNWAQGQREIYEAFIYSSRAVPRFIRWWRHGRRSSPDVSSPVS